MRCGFAFFSALFRTRSDGHVLCGEEGPEIHEGGPLAVGVVRGSFFKVKSFAGAVLPLALPLPRHVPAQGEHSVVFLPSPIRG